MSKKVRRVSGQILDQPPACGHADCSVALFIDQETLTFGRGVLDSWGCWSEPCATCARAFEQRFHSPVCWPFPADYVPGSSANDNFQRRAS